MFVDQWEMPKYEPKLMFKSPTQALHKNKGLATVGTFEIAIGNDCHGRGVRPHDMVVRLQWFHVIGGSLSAHIRRSALSCYASSPAVDASACAMRLSPGSFTSSGVPASSVPRTLMPW